MMRLIMMMLITVNVLALEQIYSNIRSTLYSRFSNSVVYGLKPEHCTPSFTVPLKCQSVQRSSLTDQLLHLHLFH